MSSGPSPEIDVVRSFLKALEAQDLDLALSYLSPEVEYQNMPFRATRSRRGAVRVLAPVTKLTGFEAQVRDIAANGPVVLTERTDGASGLVNAHLPNPSGPGVGTPDCRGVLHVDAVHH
jgi:limonene-1,2-epoxide hydrolase